MQGRLRRSLSESDLKETQENQEAEMEKDSMKTEDGKQIETDEKDKMVKKENVDTENDKNEMREVSIGSLQVIGIGSQ